MEEWRLLCRARNRIEAEVIKGLLKAAKIPAVVRGESVGTLYGLSTGALAEVRLYVPKTFLAQARALLAAAPADPPDCD